VAARLRATRSKLAHHPGQSVGPVAGPKHLAVSRHTPDEKFLSARSGHEDVGESGTGPVEKDPSTKLMKREFI